MTAGNEPTRFELKPLWIPEDGAEIELGGGGEGGGELKPYNFFEN